MVRTTRHIGGKRSFNLTGPLSMKRGSGAGDLKRAICNGTSASSFPKSFLVEPSTGEVFIPWSATTLSRICTSPIETPPDPGYAAPTRYFSTIMSETAFHRSFSCGLNKRVFSCFLSIRTSQEESDTATTCGLMLVHGWFHRIKEDVAYSQSRTHFCFVHHGPVDKDMYSNQVTGKLGCAGQSG